MPGSITSRTRQLAASVRGKTKNSSVEPKVLACKPTDSNKLLMASRTEESSSTIYTTEPGLFIRSRRVHGNGELENSTTPWTRRGPQAPIVRLDDRTADR